MRLGIGTKIDASGHTGRVTGIGSIVNLDSPQRMPVVFIVLDGTNRMVSVTGDVIEKTLDNSS